VQAGRDQSGKSQRASLSQRFPTTHWSLVGRAAASGGAEAGRRALGELIHVYLPALRAHLTGPMRIDPHRADDLLQGFLADKVLQQNMIALADPNRGRFRTFLLTALERFVIDAHRYESARKRTPRSRMLDVSAHAEQVVTPQNPSDAFDRAWAGEVLSEVMRRMKADCDGNDRRHLWGIFEARMLLPITDGAHPPEHEELARRWGLDSARQAANALGTAKRLFTRHFREVVGEYAADESEIGEELRELWEVFSRPSA
jgi:RNA polymerase sigma-70 factor (ECF subfamily)